MCPVVAIPRVSVLAVPYICSRQQAGGVKVAVNGPMLVAIRIQVSMCYFRCLLASGYGKCGQSRGRYEAEEARETRVTSD